ncbi:MAG: hypothetical protein F4187_09015, partial [Gemmatimonadetes bacterium]|nr:hypothetical protein [Gemmatimonadota bacterium]
MALPQGVAPPRSRRGSAVAVGAALLAAWAWAGAAAGQEAAGEAAGFAALRAGRYDEAVSALRGEARAGNAVALSGWVTALRETG